MRYEDEHKENPGSGGASSAPDLGGLQIPPITPSGGDPSSNPSSAAEAVLRQKRKYTKRGDNPNGGTGAKGSVPALSFEQFKMLYSPKLWGDIAASPADACALVSGKEYWHLKEDERLRMGEPLSIVAQLYSTADPRIIAVIAACVSVGTTYSGLLARMIAEKRVEKKAAAQPVEEKK